MGKAFNRFKFGGAEGAGRLRLFPLARWQTNAFSAACKVSIWSFPKNGILDDLKNHPMEFDDRILRQIPECVIINSKERIKVVFTGRMEVEQPPFGARDGTTQAGPEDPAMSLGYCPRFLSVS